MERRIIKNDPQTDYEKSEAELLKKTLRESYRHRLLRKTGWTRIQQTMEKAFISHLPLLGRGGAASPSSPPANSVRLGPETGPADNLPAPR